MPLADERRGEGGEAKEQVARGDSGEPVAAAAEAAAWPIGDTGEPGESEAAAADTTAAAAESGDSGEEVLLGEVDEVDIGEVEAAAATQAKGASSDGLFGSCWLVLLGDGCRRRSSSGDGLSQASVGTNAVPCMLDESTSSMLPETSAVTGVIIAPRVGLTTSAAAPVLRQRPSSSSALAASASCPAPSKSSWICASQRRSLISRGKGTGAEGGMKLGKGPIAAPRQFQCWLYRTGG